MNKLVMLLFISVFAAEYFAKQLAVVPGYFALMPEVVSAVAVLALVGAGLSGRRWMIERKYILFLAGYLFIVVFGFFAQAMPTGAIVTGMRNYLKYLPFFLLPAVYPFTLRQIKLQFAVLLILLAVQSPLAVYQRFVQFANRMHTGDPVVGMTTSSGVLSILMICAISALVALHLRRKIGLRVLVICMAVLFLPTTLNETKVTLFMLPVALLLPAFLMPRGSGAMRKLVPIAVIGSTACLAYVATYDQLIQNRSNGHPIESYLLDKQRLDKYLDTGAGEGKNTYVGRIDSIELALRGLAGSPLRLAFGFGAGNVSKSSIRGFDGAYADYYDRYGVGVTQISDTLWEIGLAGLVSYLLLCRLVFKDARFLALGEGEFAIAGQIWATITILMLAWFFYANVLAVNEIAYFFWFYSGVIASLACRVRRATREQARAADRPRQSVLAELGAWN